MSGEAAFINLLRALASDPAARGLMDDAAVLEVGGTRLVLTSDTLVEGVHFLSDDPPASIGWKLAAVNLSDLAAKGARPRAALMNYALSGDAAWDAEFVRGLGEALSAYHLPLIGGDTVAGPPGAPRSFTLTAIGEATSAVVPIRGGARVGDLLYISGPVGDAGAGLQRIRQGQMEPAHFADAYRRPQPHLEQGLALAPHVTAMTDVSDGLLIDAKRMADAAGIAVLIDHVPLSAPMIATYDASVETRMRAAMAGDDYVLLMAVAPGVTPPVPLLPVGRFVAGTGLSLTLDGQAVPLPERLGYEHGASSQSLT